ncbi:VWA domain-containing protein [Sulfurimonas sp.]
MTFLHPEFLYYMLPPLFILFWFLLTQKEPQGHFFSDEVMNKLRVSANTLTLKARNALFLLMGFFMIIALAGPVINDGTVEVKAKSADIMIAFDISDSMLAEDVYPNRLKSAKQKAMELLKSAPDERIGVVAFAKNSYLVSPMSFDHSAVGFLLRQLNTDSITEKGTDFLSLLNVVDNTIKNEGKKYLLILSDGGDKSDFSEEIAFAKEKNIVVFILGIGTQKGAPIKKSDGTFIKHKGEIIVSKLNENISELATSTGGVFIQGVKSTKDVETMLSEIKSNSEKKELKSEEIHKFIPLFYYPVGMALVLLIIATSSMSKREKVHLPTSLAILFSILFINPHAEAGLLDFIELKEAKKAYEAGEYEKSAELYEKHADISKNGESYFNKGNSLYKQNKFDEAIEAYQKATFDDKVSRANNSANIGNSYVKQGTSEGLQKAVESYEKSLKLNEDKEVRENLESVKKEIERQKKEQEEKEKQEEKQDKNEKNKDEKSDEKNDSKDGEKSDEEKKSDEKLDEKSEDEKDSSKSEKSEDEKQKNQDDMKSEKEQEEKQKNQENNETKPQEKKDDLKQLNKDEDNKTKDSKSSVPHAENADKMSDAEEEKWLNELNMQQNTYMYMLNNNKPKQRDENEKPW